MSTVGHVQAGRCVRGPGLRSLGGGHVAPRQGAAAQAASSQSAPPPAARLQGLASPSSCGALRQDSCRAGSPAPGERVRWACCVEAQSDPHLGRVALGGQVHGP